MTDPDYSWCGGLIELNGGRNDGWLKTPACRKVDDTYPNRLYMHSAQTDRDHSLNPDPADLPGLPALPGPYRTAKIATIPDRVLGAGLSARYYFSDLPFIALWGLKYLPIVAPSFPGVPPIPNTNAKTFFEDARDGTLPNVSFLDPKFTDTGGPESDQHPFADIRVGEAFLSAVYKAIRNSPQWQRTVLVITWDEWGGFFDHIRPPKARDDTDPATVDHTCNTNACSEPAGSHPDYGQLGFRVPCVVVSPYASPGVVHGGPYEHTSILRMIEWRWGLEPLTARDAHARNLRRGARLRPPERHARACRTGGPRLASQSDEVAPRPSDAGFPLNVVAQSMRGGPFVDAEVGRIVVERICAFKVDYAALWQM